MKTNRPAGKARSGVKPKRKLKNRDLGEIHRRYQKKQRKRIALNRVFGLILFLAVAAYIIMYHTPAFNIRQISVEGNERVSEEEIVSKAGVSKGDNLFKINISQTEKAVEGIPYVKKADIKRKLLVPGLKMNIIESTAEAYLDIGEKYLLIDRDSVVLEETDIAANDLPQILGLNLQNYSLGGKLNIDESEKCDIIFICIDVMDKCGMIKNVDSISVEDTSDISFIYQNRLTVKCGSKLDFENKIKLFVSSVKSGKLADNSRGTIDLSTKGKAIYTP